MRKILNFLGCTPIHHVKVIGDPIVKLHGWEYTFKHVSITHRLFGIKLYTTTKFRVI